jgi:hypothetical protein
VKKITTTIKEYMSIPAKILCNCMNRNQIPNSVVFDTFFFVPTNILDEILPKLEECARQMVATYKSCSILEMDVSIHIRTTVKDDNGQVQQIMGLLEKFQFDYPSSDSPIAGQCSIGEIPGASVDRCSI